MEVAGTFDTKFVAESSSFLLNQCLFSPAPFLQDSHLRGGECSFEKRVFSSLPWHKMAPSDLLLIYEPLTNVLLNIWETLCFLKALSFPLFTA